VTLYSLCSLLQMMSCLTANKHSLASKSGQACRSYGICPKDTRLDRLLFRMATLQNTLKAGPKLEIAT
jgi:hypothetical protein